MSVLTRRRTEPDVVAPTAGQTSSEVAAPAVEPARKQSWFERRRQTQALRGAFDTYPHLLALKPREKYVFRSDYFEVDGSVACVLAFFHDDAAHDNFGAFWGINRIPAGLDEAVTTVILEQVKRMDDKWVDQYIKVSEKLDKLDAGEQAETGTASSRRRAAKVAGDMEVISAEIQDGASYLNVHTRLFVNAPSLEVLDESIERITRLYIDRFGTLKIAAYAGEQRQELTGLFKPNKDKRGKGFGFTSIELAGSYSLVTNGLNDPGGEYVGHMVGDVNNSAVLLDVNDYERSVVIADSSVNDDLPGRPKVANMWASKVSQSCMLNNGSVVHLVLDGADLDGLGPRFDAITARVDLNSGDVNPFEMFGETADELAIFAAQMQKLVLMFEQVYEATDSDRSIIRGELEKTATQFYIDQGMWIRNAKLQRDRLRVINVPHQQVPRLQMFVSYLETAHKALLNSTARDDEKLHAYGVLSVIAKNLLDNNGDLFNNHTSAAIDGVRDAKRVVYDFSRLLRRGKGVAMAQLVNIVGFAVGKLGHGDTVIIHGTEFVDAGVKAYIEMQFEHLYHRGGRVVFCYNDIDKMLADSAFNRFDAADYTILGAMRDRALADYQAQLHQRIPPDLAGLVTARGQRLNYLRRGVSNVVFHLDLALGINPARQAQRAALRAELEQLEAQSHQQAGRQVQPVQPTRPTAPTARPGANVTGPVKAAASPNSPSSPSSPSSQATLPRRRVSAQ